MNLEDIRQSLPEYAKDLKLNLSSVLRSTDISEEQLWGTVASVACLVRHDDFRNALLEEAATHLSETALNAAKGAAALMGMNNIFYRFGHLSGHEKFLKMPAGLRMNFMRSHGVEDASFELWSIAVSAVNGCGLCIESHWAKLKETGMAEAAVLAAVKIASIIPAIDNVLVTETSRQ